MGWQDAPLTQPTAAPRPRWQDAQVVDEEAERPKRSFLEGVGDWFAGKGDTEYDYPELPGTSYKGRPVNWLMSPALSDEERTAIFGTVTGGNVTITKDKFGNPFIEIDEADAKDFTTSRRETGGKTIKPGRYYLDRPGYTPQTGRTIASMVGLGILPAAAAGRALQGASLGGRMLQGAAAALGAEGMRQTAVSAAAEEPMYDPLLLGVAGAGGAALEGIAGPIVRAVGRRVRFGAKQITGDPHFDPRSGQWTPEGRKLLEQTGVVIRGVDERLDPTAAAGSHAAPDNADAMGWEFLRQKEVLSDPRAALRAAQSKSLPIPFKERASKLNADARMQATENLASQGHLGQPAADALRKQQYAENVALEQNQAAIMRQVAGKGVNVDEGAAGGHFGKGTYLKPVQTKLIEMRRQQSAHVDDLYEQAKRSGDVELPLTRLSEGKVYVGEQLRDAGFSPSATGPVAQVLEQLDVPISKFEQRLGMGTENATSATVNRVFNVRQQLAEIQRNMGMTNPGAAKAAGLAKSALDQWIGRSMVSDLAIGSKSAIASWRRAITARRDFGKFWQDVDLVDELSAIGPDGEPLYDPQDIANVVLGLTTRGMSNKRELTRSMAKLKTLFGSDSDAWKGIKGEVLARIFMKGIRDPGNPNVVYSVDGNTILKEWNILKFENPTLLATLFSSEDIRLITNYAQVAARTTGHSQGAYNASNTAAFSWLLQKLDAVMGVVPGGKLPGVLFRNLVNVVPSAAPDSFAAKVLGAQYGPYGRTAPGGGALGPVGGSWAVNRVGRPDAGSR